ncbi:MAG: hypothetical protein NT002_09485 [candidate division Zixibacteria bacterium]|jgi:hypothetical protein|nr:hypothetical protein [candidate division Zixibacteria bacterium]
MENGNGKISWAALLNRPIFNFVMALLGMSAAYFTTIGSIKVQLAEKAETVLVEALDKRLARIEVVIKEGRVSKDEFFEFRNNIDSRLTRIEFYLTEQRRGK